MNKHEEYVKDKTFLSYQKYIKGEFFEKARAVVLKDGKIALIKDLSNGKITVPGGGVDDGESVAEAAVREALEETGMIVRVLFPFHENYYDVPMKYGDIDFVSKRRETYFLCEFVKQDKNSHGLDGEYAGNTEIYFDEIDKLLDLHVSKEGVEKVKEYLNVLNLRM